ncbi:RHS repeat-associated core domain-containing protein [Burkholderia sp. ABCPW 111]|uniref:RHS repeat-associated core domain-containing protein n=1 Tax=Burkholderia sp. ABCPW 111 TaxID=1820025 RepID=UPI000572189D|nr:RHS repeat-associated core domain-containing protein [Burkholderia sp. ABCPW 111]
MSGIGGLAGVLAGLEGNLMESVGVAPAIGRYRHQPGNWGARHGVERALSGLLCRSVDMKSGNKVCLADDEIDFTLPGRLPISWARFYSSALKESGPLGCGWRTGWEVTLRRDGERLIYTDDQGRVLTLPMPRCGAQIIVSSEQLHFAHLSDGRMVVADLTPHYRVFGEFDEEGVARLKYMENLRKERIGCIWDTHGRLQRMRGTCGHELKMHYDRNGSRLTGIECVDGGPTGFLVRYGYDDDGRLTSVRNRIGDVVRRFAYENDRIVEEVGSLGQTTRYAWQTIDGTPRVVERMTCRGAHERCTYNFDEPDSQATDVFGHTAHWQFGDHGLVLAYVDFDGRRHAFGYDGAGWPTELELPGDRRVRMTFDNLGRITREIDSLDRERSTIYAFATREPITIRTSNGQLWLWRYDDLLRPVYRQSPSRGATQIAYAEHEDGEIHTYASGQHGAVTVEYDRWACVIRQVEAHGGATIYRRDENGHVVEIVDPLGGTTKIEPDLLGRPLTVTLPDGRCERLVWNAGGQATLLTGPDGQTRYWHRDQHGCVVRATDEEGNVTAHEYDAHGRRIRTVSGNGAVQMLAWDPIGRLTSIIDADGVTRTFDYTMAGCLQQITTNAGSSTRLESFAHDSAGRLIGRETEHARYRYAYTSKGWLETVGCLPTDAGEAIGVEPDTIRFEYDQSGRLTAEHGASGTLRHERDEAGRPGAVILAHGHVVKLERDDAGRVVLIGLASGSENRGIAALRYDELGRQVLRSQGELYLRSVFTPTSSLERWFAMTVIRTPDNEMRAGEVERWREFRYSVAGNLVQVDDRFDGRTYYDYDRRGCLLRSVSDELGIEYFTWDAAGNLLETPRVGWEAVVYPDHRLRECRGYRYEYDVWGNVTGKQGAADEQSFTWDADGRLMEVRGRQVCVRLRYDALGRRVRKCVEHLRTDPLRSEPRTVDTRYVWEGERLLQESTQAAVRTYLYQPADDGLVGYAPLACADQKRNEDGTLEPMRVYHYQTDSAGTAVTLTDEAGVLAWSGRYKAWGTLAPPTALQPQVRQPLRFAGHYADDEIGLHLNGTRYYDPDAGRYLSPDRAAEAGTSPYRYVSNPLIACNPTGRAVPLTRPPAGRHTASCSDRSLDPSKQLTGGIEEVDQVIRREPIQFGREY